MSVSILFDRIELCFEGYCNNLKVLYSCGSKAAVPKGTTQRQIPQQPERILDAPELFDDYCKFLCQVKVLIQVTYIVKITSEVNCQFQPMYGNM